HRNTGELLYDSASTALQSSSGMAYLDEGYIATEPWRGGVNINNISDPLLRGILNMLRINVGEPSRALANGAAFYFQNAELVEARVRQGLAAQVLEKFGDMWKIFVGFLAAHGLSIVMMVMPPPFPLIGAAIRGLIATAGWVMQIDFL